MGLRKQLGEAHDVVKISATKGIDGLGIIAHHHHIVMTVSHQPHDLGLHQIGILVLIDHDMGEAGGNFPTRLRNLCQQPFPVDQEIVIIHQAMRKFKLLIVTLQLEKVFDVLTKMDILGKDQVIKGFRFIDRPADHIDDDSLGGKLEIPSGKTERGLEEIDDPFGIRAIDDGKVRAETQRRAIPPQEQIGRAMKGAAHHPVTGIVEEATRPPQHLLR